MAKSKTPRQRLPKEVREQQILDAAFECFCAKGFRGASINDIVASAGMSKGNIYWYFSNKNDLFLAVLDWWIDQAFERLTDSLELKDMVISEMFDRMSKRLYDLSNKDRSFMFAWMEFNSEACRDEEVRKRMVQFEEDFHDKLTQYFKNAMQKGEIKVMNAPVLASVFASIYGGVMFRGVIWPEKFSKREVIGEIMDLFKDLIGLDEKKSESKQPETCSGLEKVIE